MSRDKMEPQIRVPEKSSFWANLFKSPTDKNELEEVLASIPPFKNLTPKYLKLLMKLIHNRFYKANEYIFYQNDPGIALYIIVSGEVLITQENEDGEQFDLAHLTRGDFFGELALIDEERRAASSVALKDSFIAAIFKPDLDEFIEAHPQEGIKILKGLIHIIATRLRNVNKEYLELYNQIRTREKQL
ncbi:cAMP-binding protein [Melioribacter roseus P3M-2]|uniref:cAMP-binding protein n=2 Tax=Melioribacter roseus TaxID=1134405 RepID=I6ZVH0_MELRP|nr:cAMP-binding protein [Melioribacter roseus P3M-2]